MVCGFWKPPRSVQARWRSDRCSLRPATSSTPARGLVTIRDGRAEMSMYLTEADGLDFKLVEML